MRHALSLLMKLMLLDEPEEQVSVEAMMSVSRSDSTESA